MGLSGEDFIENPNRVSYVDDDELDYPSDEELMFGTPTELINLDLVFDSDNEETEELDSPDDEASNCDEDEFYTSSSDNEVEFMGFGTYESNVSEARQESMTEWTTNNSKPKETPTEPTENPDISEA